MRGVKDPSDVRTFKINWARELDGETIITSSWVTNGLTNDQDGTSVSETTIRVSGGSAGDINDLVNTITTSSGETLEKTISVYVREQ